MGLAPSLVYPLSVCLAISYGLLTRKQTGVKEPKLARTFPGQD